MYEKGKVPTPFPILIDAERTLTEGLGIFTTEWSGSKIDQNIPTILILDKKGIIKFKYMSQNTLDRPSADYLMNFVETLER
jgi:peroxiredoxin